MGHYVQLQLISASDQTETHKISETLLSKLKTDM